MFPGSELQWNALTDLTDARLLATHLEWAVLTPAAHNCAFNVVNGDILRWRWLWPQLAAYFKIECAPPPQRPLPLEARMSSAHSKWERIASKYNLIESRVDHLASWWHTDADLGREIECVNDMTNSRKLGFGSYQQTPQSFFDLFRKLEEARVIPAYSDLDSLVISSKYQPAEQHFDS